MSFIGVNRGSTGSPTVIVSVVGFAHSPGSGVKVYKVVIVLSSAGLQVPLIPSLEVVGKGAKTAPLQIPPTAIKVGSTL